MAIYEENGEDIIFLVAKWSKSGSVWLGLRFFVIYCVRIRCKATAFVVIFITIFVRFILKLVLPKGENYESETII